MCSLDCFANLFFQYLKTIHLTIFKMITIAKSYYIKTPIFSKRKSTSLLKKRTHILTKRVNKFQTNSYMNDTIVALNKFTNSDTWQLTSHTIVNFSAIFFTVNWLYYRSIRIKMEKKDKKDKKDDKK